MAPSINGNRIVEQARHEAGLRLKRRQKIIPSREKGSRPRGLPKDVIKQNFLRKKFGAIAQQLALAPVREIGTGVDYVHWFYYGKEKKTTKIDLKFSFGLLGNETIKVRIADKKLINNSNWVMAMDQSNSLAFFPTKALHRYVRECWGSLSQRHMIDKGHYKEYPVSLADLYRKMKILPIRAKLNPQSIGEALKQMREIEFGKEAERKKGLAIIKGRKAPLPSQALRKSESFRELAPRSKKSIDQRKIIRTYQQGHR